MVTKTNNPFFALQCVLKGFAWLGKSGLRKFLLVPILINLVLYSLAFVLGYLYLPNFIAQLIPAWLHWLSWLITPLFFICFIIAGFFSFTVLANLISSPFYGRLSAQTLALLIHVKQTNQTNEDDETELEFDFTEPNALHTMLGELRRIGYLLKWLLVLVIISLIPVVNLIAPVLWAIFGAWGCALEFFAYPLENKKLVFPAQKEFLSNVRLGALSFGGVVVLGLGLPFFNLLVAPAAVIAATVYVFEIDEAAKRENNS